MATPSATEPSRAEWRKDSTADLVIAIIAAIFLWRFSSVGIVATVIAADILACCVLWLVITVPPWFPHWRRRDKIAAVGLCAITFCIVVLILLVHGDLSDSRKPNLRGTIDSVVPWIRDGQTYFLLGVDLENTGGPTYVKTWQPFFITSDGRRIDGSVFPRPAVGHPITIPLGSRGFESTYSSEHSILRTLETTVQSDSAVSGSLMVYFPTEGPQPENTAIKLNFQDRLDYVYTALDTPDMHTLNTH